MSFSGWESKKFNYKQTDINQALINSSLVPQLRFVETCQKKPLQAHKKNGQKSISYGINPCISHRKRASASTSPISTEGSMTVEAALLMSFILLAVNVLFYFFYLMEFQIELQFSMERSIREAVINQAGHLQETAALYHTVTREVSEKEIFLEAGDIRLVRNEDALGDGREFLDMTAVFEAGPGIKFLGPMKGIYIQRCRRRFWSGQDFIEKEGIEQEDSKEEYVYVTQNGIVYHKNRDCTYLRLSVRPVSGIVVPMLRSSDGSKYKPCERCIKFVGASYQTVYITDFGDRYHNSRECSSLKRWVMKVPIEEIKGKAPCSKCGQK